MAQCFNIRDKGLAFNNRGSSSSRLNNRDLNELFVIFELIKKNLAK